MAVKHVIVSRYLLRLVLGVTVLAGIVLVIMYRDLIDFERLNDFLKGLGWKAPLFFIFAYAIATVLFFPGSILTLAGGAIFGPYYGTLYALTGATIGATVAFLISRYLGADWINRKLSGKVEKILRGAEREGWRFVAFARLVPLFPFNALNYALGLTRIPLMHYVIASFVFMLPGAFVYNWLGYAGREALAGSEKTWEIVFIAASLFVASLFLPRIVKSIRTTPDDDINKP